MDMNNPLGWTRQSNIDGFLTGTYDVIACWRRGPDSEPMSDVSVHSRLEAGMRFFGWTKSTNYHAYISGDESMIACWPNKPEVESIKLYIKETK